jgi:hypothetical protein
MQTKSNPITTLTERNSAQRNSLAGLGQAWFNTLDQTQRDAWTALAVANPLPNQWGDEFPISGVAFFIRTNLTLLAIGVAQIDDAPADQAVTALASLTLSVTAPATASITFTPTPTTAGHRLLLAATSEASPGQTATALHYWFLQHGGAAEASPLNVATPYLARVGAFAAGKRYAVRGVQVNSANGARSAEFFATTLAL